MTCREVAQFLADYVSGHLPAEVAADFDRHLFECSNCQEFLKQYQATTVAGALAWRAAGELDAPEDLVTAVLQTMKSVR